MKRKNDLHRLIHAMSKSEKRYFNLDAKKSGKKDAAYLQLFSTINKMETNDEATLKAKFKHLSVDKAYLYNAILRSMRDYHSKKSRAAQIKEKLMDAKYLYERELYDLCEEALHEAKKLAEELGDHLSLLEINKQMRKVVKTTKKGIGEGALVSLQEESSATSQNLSLEFDALNLYDDIFFDAILKKKMTQEQIGLFQENLSSFQGKINLNSNSIHAEHRYLQARGLFYDVIQNFDDFFDFYAKVMNWWDENSTFKEEEFYNYIIDVSNYLGACFRRERFDEFKNLIERLEGEKPSNVHHQKILFQRILQFKLVFCINFGITEDVKTIENQVASGLLRFSINQNTEKALLLNTAILHFIAEKFEDCIEWSNKLMKDTKKDVRIDMTRGAYLMKLISSYEIDDFELFDNTFRSANRFIIKENDQYLKYYLQFLDKIKKLPAVPVNETKHLLNDLKNYINQMRQEIKGRVPLGGIDEMTIWWIDSKLQKKSIAEIVRASRKS